MSDSELIYHYTAASGLQGIVESGVLWMTDVRHLNDSAELAYGARIMRELVDAKIADVLGEVDPAADGGAARSRVSLLTNIQSYFDRIESGDDYEYSTYAASFCTDGNLLSQWRGYGGGVLGYSLGFDRTLLSKAVIDAGQESADIGKSLELSAVNYNSGSVNSALKAAVDELAPHPSGHPGVHAWDQFGRIALPVLAKIKSAGFEEEREWRLLLTRDGYRDGVKFRPGRTGLVPYVEAKWPVKALRRVTVGPGPDLQLRAAAVRQLLHSSLGNQMHQVEVSTSDIPFRV